MKATAPSVRPWYRHAWPWALMAAPAAAIAMGVVMVVLALRSEDGLVVDDYYKRGLAINQVLAREARAAELKLTASLAFSPGHDRVRVVIDGARPVSGRATLRLVHPTRVGQDQTVALAAAGPGVLEGTLVPPSSGRWRVVLEDPAGEWRLAGVWHTDDAAVTLNAAAAGG
jgi:hypothetical protein